MPDISVHTLDGLLPQEVRAPASVAELAKELAEAATKGLSVVPWGGGTQMGLGNPPAKFDLALQTCKLDRLVEHSPADLTATVQAGMTLAALQKALAPHRQHVALDAPLPQRATIGGILATASAGPRRFSYGLPRDQVIGMKVAHPDGKVTHAGGKVVKNVAGYDVMKLYVGSLGTLGVIVEATFRLSPLPATVSTVLLGCTSLDQAISLGHQVQEARLQPLAMDALDSRAAQRIQGVAQLRDLQPQWLLAVEFGGGEATVERQIREAQAIAYAAGCPAAVLNSEASQDFWSAVRDFGRGESGAALILRATALPSQLPQLGAKASTAINTAGLPSPSLIARAGNGVLYAFWSAEEVGQAQPTSWASVIETLRDASVQAGGSTVVEECPLQLRGAIDVWGAAPEAMPIMGRLKELFDPQGVLNPGRYVGGL